MKTILTLVACLSIASTVIASACCGDKDKDAKKECPPAQSHLVQVDLR